MRRKRASLESRGSGAEDARRLAGHRIFGSKPGAYGAGLQALIDEKLWAERADLARAYMIWGAYAYGARRTRRARRATLSPRASSASRPWSTTRTIASTTSSIPTTTTSSRAA